LIIYLLTQGASFFEDFLLAVNTAQDNIDPENYASVTSLSVLIGQPVAVVRARLNLELKGQAAVNQGWATFQQDLSRNYRSTDGFDAVKFPVRIGEYEQLNDGTIGYWLEEGNDYADQTFYAPQAEANPNTQIKGHTEASFEFELGSKGLDKYLTLLLDPRGKTHATTGIMPVKELEIPAIHYAAAMASMEVSFLSAPVLSTNLNMSIPTNTQAGYSWSWVAKTGNNWQETTDLSSPRTDAVFEGGQQLVEGWLKLKPTPKQIENESDDEAAGFSSLDIQS